MGTGSGLVTPVLKDVQGRGLSSISREIVGFEDSLFSDTGAEIEASKLAVGTFSIHNLGESTAPALDFLFIYVFICGYRSNTYSVGLHISAAVAGARLA